MAVTHRAGTARPASAGPLGVVAAGSMAVPDVLTRLGSDRTGLAAAEAARRLRVLGPNAVRSHRARALPVLGRQLRSPLLILLAVTAGASFFVGERSDAVIIGVILLPSVGLGFVNEYRAEKAAEALHSSIRHRCVVLRSGHPRSADVTQLVPGDVIELQLGEIVPADLRLLAIAGLECDESVLTGESVPAEKSAEAVPAGTPLAELSCCALMGTVVRSRYRPGRRGRHGGRDRIRPDRPRPLRPPAGDRVPSRAAQVLHAARRKSPASLTALHLRHQRGLAPTSHRRTAVLARHRRRHHPAAAPRRRVHQPRRRLTAAGPTQGAGQAAGVHRGSRRHRRAVHRQDRHPHRGPPHASCGSSGADGRHRRRATATGAAVQRGVRAATSSPVGGNPLDVALWELTSRAGPEARRWPATQRLGHAAVRPRAPAGARCWSTTTPASRTIITKGAPEGLLDRCVEVPPAARARPRAPSSRPATAWSPSPPAPAPGAVGHHRGRRA